MHGDDPADTLAAMQTGKLLLAAVAAVALAPATAAAATTSFDGDTLVYAPDNGDAVSVLLTSRAGDDDVKYLSFSDSARTSFTDRTGGYCFVPQSDTSALLCRLEPRRPIRIEGSDNRDSISIFSSSDVPNTIPITLKGNGGDDTLKDAYDANAGRVFDGGAGADKIEAYGGNDVLLGGDGNDDLDGGEGNDELRGGSGDDKLAGDGYAAPGSDIMDGGDGVDMVDEWNDPSGNVHPQPAVSLDGVANDGRPGENDNVTNIEKFTSHVSIAFSGGDAAETVEVTNPSDEQPSTLFGNGGNDVLTGYDFDDRIDGGAGDDRLFGGFGNDVITGGPGKDTIYGDQTSSYCGYSSCKIPFGNDTIDAADGEADQVDCGVGEDTAKVDAIDTVVNCEKVDRVGAAPSGPATAGTATGDQTSGGGTPVGIVGRTSRSSLRQGKLALALDCAAACRVTATATVGKATARRLGLKGTTLATGTRTLLSGGKASVPLKLARPARPRLGRVKGALAVAVKLIVTGADGSQQVVTKQLSLT